MRQALVGGSLNLSPGVLRLSTWTADFNPNSMKLTNTQCWTRICGLSLEYWRKNILFSIVRGIGVPISIDNATANKSFGLYARVLVDVDLKAPMPDQILVECEGFAFFVDIQYERLLEFCSHCNNIVHAVAECRHITPNAKTNKQFSPKFDARTAEIDIPKNPQNSTEGSHVEENRENNADMSLEHILETANDKESSYHNREPSSAETPKDTVGTNCQTDAEGTQEPPTQSPNMVNSPTKSASSTGKRIVPPPPNIVVLSLTLYIPQCIINLLRKLALVALDIISVIRFLILH